MSTTADPVVGSDAPAEPGRPPSLGPLGWARWSWRQLTSMRTALILLFLLALAAVPGSFFPQRSVDPGEVAAFFRAHPGLAPWLDRLGLFGVYASAWFSAIYLLLLVSLAGCVLPRARAHWRAVRAAPPAAPRRLGRLPVARTYDTGAAPAEVLAAARAVLRDRRFRVVGSGEAMSAEKGHLHESGNLVFHLALLLVLGAVAVGHFSSWTGDVVVAEGRGFSNTISQYDDFRAGTSVDAGDLPPFNLTLERLDVRYEERAVRQLGAPREFTANVRYRPAPDASWRTAQIRPNAPLHVDGTKVFLLGNGYAPRVTVRDGTGEVLLQAPVPLRPVKGDPGMRSDGVLKVPDAQPSDLGLTVTLLPTFVDPPNSAPVSAFPDARDPRLLVTGAWQGDLGLDDGVPQSVFRLDTSAMTPLEADGQRVTATLAPGETLTLPDGRGSVTFEAVARFAALQVSDDPGSGWALAAASLALAGLLGSLFVRRRRVWVRATAAEDRTVVEVGALARTEYDGLGDEVDDLVADLRSRESTWAARPSRS